MMMVISAADDNCVHFFIIAQCEKRSLLFIKGSSQTNSRVSCSCEHVHGRRLVRAGKRPRWSRGSEGSSPYKSVFKWGEKDERVLCKKHRTCSWFSLVQSWLHYPSFFHWMTWVCLSFNWWVWAPSTLTMSFYCHLLDKCKTPPSAPSAPSRTAWCWGCVRCCLSRCSYLQCRWLVLHVKYCVLGVNMAEVQHNERCSLRSFKRALIV